MSNDAGSIDRKAADENNDRATQALGSYQSNIGSFMSNVNSTLAAGNPYQSKDYLTKQNLETSGAMNSQNDALENALGQTVARTGTNSAGLAGTMAAAKRAGQRDLTDYEATRDTQNQDKWLQQRDALLREQLGGANSEADVFGTSLGARSRDLASMTSAMNAQQQMWAELGGKAVQAAGTMGGAAMG